MGNNVSNTEELFLNVRKSIRLLYEYQHRVQGTMFHIKQLLNLSPSNRIEVNPLFSNLPEKSKQYGQLKLSHGKWAWDFLLIMAMEYHLGEKNLAKKYWLGMSVIVVIDDGFFRTRKDNPAVQELDTNIFVNVGFSNTIALFVMSIMETEKEWKKLWTRDNMRLYLRKWLDDDQDTISDKTEAGNDFIVMKFKLSELVTEDNINIVLNKINNKIKDITGYTVY